MSTNRSFSSRPIFQMPGGYSLTTLADSDIQNIVDSISEDIQTKAEKQFSKLQAVTYRTQVVRGYNYLIKVDTGDDGEHIHVFVSKQLESDGGQIRLLHLERGKTVNDEIEA